MGILKTGNIINIHGHDYEEVITTINDLEEGDYLLGTHGYTRIMKLHDKHTPQEMYRLTNEYGETIDVSGDHLFYIETDDDILSFPSHARRLKKTLKKNKKYWNNITRLSEKEENATASVIHICYKIFENDTPVMIHKKNVFHDILRQCSAVGHVIQAEPPYDHIRDLWEYNISHVCSNIIKTIQGNTDALRGRVTSTHDIVENIGIENITLPERKHKERKKK